MKKYYPNILIISGEGKNCGKTTMACKIIEQFKEDNIIAIKTSNHLHPQKEDILCLEKTEEYEVYEETRNDMDRDSSKMLKAGAKKSYYLQGEFQYRSIEKILKKHSWSPIVCESGKLLDWIHPGVHIYNQAAEKQTLYFSKTDERIANISLKNNNWEYTI